MTLEKKRKIKIHWATLIQQSVCTWSRPHSSVEYSFLFFSLSCRAINLHIQTISLLGPSYLCPGGLKAPVQFSELVLSEETLWPYTEGILSSLQISWTDTSLFQKRSANIKFQFVFVIALFVSELPRGKSHINRAFHFCFSQLSLRVMLKSKCPFCLFLLISKLALTATTTKMMMSSIKQKLILTLFSKISWILECKYKRNYLESNMTSTHLCFCHFQMQRWVKIHENSAECKEQCPFWGPLSCLWCLHTWFFKFSPSLELHRNIVLKWPKGSMPF
jgi:hypothetical protein